MSRVLAPSDSRSGNPRPGNLPAELSSFVGRDADLAQLAELQARAPFLTLVGPGGVGKTRLARRLAAGLHDSYPDGIWLVDVAPLTEGSIVAQAVADVLGVREEPGQPYLRTLEYRLRSHQLLLILDNCDYLVGSCAELAEALLRACHDVRILATARQPVETISEQTWRVHPLSVPASGTIERSEVLASEAVALFIARAKTRAPEFKLTDRSLGLIATICRQLDGLPLAIELVAARIESFDLSEIAARLETGFRLRFTGYRTAPARQQTLRATLDWSYAMLSLEEARLLRRLAVFAGGWRLESAQAVCADAALPVTSIAVLLDRLAAKSLVIVEHYRSGARYFLLETMREYALEWLEASDEAAEFRQRHAVHILELAELAHPEPLEPAHAALLQSEQEEVRAALAWAVGRPEVELALRLAIGANAWWYVRGHYAEGREWFERVLALPEANATAFGVRARWFLGRLLLRQGEFPAAEAAAELALSGYIAAGDELGIALATRLLGSVALSRGDLARAGPLVGEAARRLHQLADPGEFDALRSYAAVALELGELDLALEVATDIEARGRAWRPQLTSAWSSLLRGSVAARSGDASLAEDLLSDAFELQKPLEVIHLKVVVLTELGHTLMDRGALDRAKRTFGEATQAAYDAGMLTLLSRALDGVARSAAVSQPVDALRLAAAAERMRSTRGVISLPADLGRAAGWLSAARGALGEHAFDAAWFAGGALTVDDAIDVARAALDGTGAAAEQTGSPLTRRETEVAALVARGMSTSGIATELVISVATVRVHVDHIMAKLDLHSRIQIAAWVNDHAPMMALQTAPTRDRASSPR
jgi:predicted ATPase/DNA-binding CsgD family transcriptional regulator